MHYYKNYTSNFPVYTNTSSTSITLDQCNTTTGTTTDSIAVSYPYGNTGYTSHHIGDPYRPHTAPVQQARQPSARWEPQRNQFESITRFSAAEIDRLIRKCDDILAWSKPIEEIAELDDDEFYL